MLGRPVFIATLLAVIAAAGVPSSAMPIREIPVTVTNAGFSPRSATIVAGMRVVFLVRDHHRHQLRMKSGAPSGVPPRTVLSAYGAFVGVMPTSLGTYVYIDVMHPTSEFRLTVAG